MGLHSRYIVNYLSVFNRSQLLVLVLEHIFADVDDACKQLAHFLRVDQTLFPQNVRAGKVNRGYITKYRHLSALSWSVNDYAVHREQYWLAELIRNNNVLQTLLKKEGEKLAPMKQETHRRLQDKYRAEITDLEILLGIDLGHWLAGYQ